MDSEDILALPAMLDAGIYLAPSAFEAGFVSVRHDDAVIEATLTTARDAFAEVARSKTESPARPDASVCCRHKNIALSPHCILDTLIRNNLTYLVRPEHTLSTICFSSIDFPSISAAGFLLFSADRNRRL
jgi:hypothetical protein